LIARFKVWKHFKKDWRRADMKSGMCSNKFACKVYLLKNSQAVKKGVALCKMAGMKKVVKFRW